MKSKPTGMNQEEKWLLALSIAWGVGALVAGITTLVMGRRSGNTSNKNAPQLSVDNPGTQAEFPTSATESGIG